MFKQFSAVVCQLLIVSGFAKNMLKKYFLSFLNIVTKLGRNLTRLSVLLFKLGLAYYLVLEIGQEAFLRYVKTDNLTHLGVASITPLAITLSFSGLMYSRVRAIESKKARFKSLYIAERLLVAAGYYLVALISMFLTYLIVVKYHLDVKLGDQIVRIYLIPFLFFVLFTMEMFAVLGCFDLNFSGRMTKFVALRVRRLLRPD